MANHEEEGKLTVATATQLKQELLTEPSVTQTEQNQILVSAQTFVDTLIASDFKQIQNQQSSVSKVEDIGVDIQYQAGKQMDMLKQPIGNLSKRAEDGGEVANALIELKMTIESLDPSQVDFSPGWFSRLLGFIPGIGTPIKRYLTKFESAQTVMSSVVRSLEMGRDQLQRDNVTLKDEQQQLWETEKKLEQVIVYATAVDKQLEQKKVSVQSTDAEQAKFMEEYLQFPVRQRVIDLQQQLAVQQQTVIASEIIIRNNKELIRGVNRALNVTVTALQNATTIALALANQDKVLQKVEKVNETTSKLITDTAKRLKTQGSLIHKGAASAQIDVQALRDALNDIKSALDDISTFRQQALPNMAAVIEDMNKLIKEAAPPLSKIEKE